METVEPVEIARIIFATLAIAISAYEVVATIRMLVVLHNSGLNGPREIVLRSWIRSATSRLLTASVLLATSLIATLLTPPLVSPILTPLRSTAQVLYLLLAAWIMLDSALNWYDRFAMWPYVGDPARGFTDTPDSSPH